MTLSEQYWHLSYRADPVSCALADRHYSRQKPGSPQFVPPGRCLVLRTQPGDAVWVTSWPFAQYVKHQWAGAWVCSFFRNESALLSSTLIVQAVAATIALWAPPALGIVTFIDTRHVRKKRDWGRCYRRAGWTALPTRTKGGLVVLQCLPVDMPLPLPALGTQGILALAPPPVVH